MDRSYIDVPGAGTARTAAASRPQLFRRMPTGRSVSSAPRRSIEMEDMIEDAPPDTDGPAEAGSCARISPISISGYSRTGPGEIRCWSGYANARSLSRPPAPCAIC